MNDVRYRLGEANEELGLNAKQEAGA